MTYAGIPTSFRLPVMSPEKQKFHRKKMIQLNLFDQHVPIRENCANHFPGNLTIMKKVIEWKKYF